MAVTLYQLSETIKKSVPKGSWQELINEVRKAYAFVVKAIWFENKKVDVGELDGAFVITFKNQTPVLDAVEGRYYIDLQSTYIQLPQESGIVSVCYMTEPNVNFVLTNAGTVGRLSRIKAGVMGGRELYYVDNKKMYFPRMRASKDVMLRLGLALDNYDVDEPLNIPTNVQEQITQMVIAKYVPQVAPINEKIK